MFIIAPTEDEYIPYQIETAYVFEHVGSPERFLVSFVDKRHMMVAEIEAMKRINHFATAFFGAYLQGKSEYRDYFSEDFHPARASGLGCVRGRVMRAGPDPGSA
jgi:hypothetical protein